MQALLIILGIYLLYKFIADFVIPVYKTTKRVQEQFRTMQQRTNVNSQPARENFNSRPADPVKANSKDYIEFEEIKD